MTKQIHKSILLLSYFPGSYVLVWQKGDDVLTAQSIMVSPDRRFKLLPDHTLELRNINPRDGGDYSCKISVLGDPIEITHTLEILRKSINPVIFCIQKAWWLSKISFPIAPKIY